MNQAMIVTMLLSKLVLLKGEIKIPGGEGGGDEGEGEFVNCLYSESKLRKKRKREESEMEAHASRVHKSRPLLPLSPVSGSPSLL